jgi:hypothetical protein
VFTREAAVEISPLINSTEIRIERDGQLERRRFIHTDSAGVELTAVVEVDQENRRLVEQAREVPSHFCCFPLVGSESLAMSIILHSLQFEPDTARERLMLEDPERDSETGGPTRCGVNRRILNGAIPLFRRLVEYFARGHDNLHLLLKGLRCAPKHLPSFDPEWFTTEIIAEYRKIVCDYALFDTRVDRCKLFDPAGTPLVWFVSGEYEPANLYRLVRQYLGDGGVPIEDRNDSWASVIWDGCGRATIE